MSVKSKNQSVKISKSDTKFEESALFRLPPVTFFWNALIYLASLAQPWFGLGFGILYLHQTDMGYKRTGRICLIFMLFGIFFKIIGALAQVSDTGDGLLLSPYY